MVTYDNVLKESEILRLELLSTIDKAKRIIKICDKRKRKKNAKKSS